MKRYLLLSLLFVAFVSCKKNNTPPSIAGTWELRVEGGMTPTIFYARGNDTILKFIGNTYEKSIDGQRTANGTYRLMKDTYQTYQGISYKGNRIIFDNNTTTSRIFYMIKRNTLTFFWDTNMLNKSFSQYERIN